MCSLHLKNNNDANGYYCVYYQVICMFMPLKDGIKILLIAFIVQFYLCFIVAVH